TRSPASGARICEPKPSAGHGSRPRSLARSAPARHRRRFMKRIFRPSVVRPDASRDVRDEIEFHLEMRTREFMEKGLWGEDARRAALAAFGDTAAIDAQLRSARATYIGERARHDRLGALRADLSFAMRTLGQRLGFTAAALATLGLGIGAASSVYTIVNG